LTLPIVVAATSRALGAGAALTTVRPRYRNLHSQHGRRRTGYPPALPGYRHPAAVRHYSRSGPRLDASLANAFRTSDWAKPNCRAICDGLTPALKLARTAFSFPGVK
jgi:hypothetical protein